MKRLVNLRVDEDVLAAFDALAESQGRSRTSAIVRLMRRAAGMDAAPEPPKSSGPKRSGQVQTMFKKGS